jgi:hypothetical protein
MSHGKLCYKFVGGRSWVRTPAGANSLKQQSAYSPTRTHYPDSEPASLCSFSLMLVLSKEATNTNFIVLGLTRPGFEPMIYRTRGEHAVSRSGQ